MNDQASQQCVNSTEKRHNDWGRHITSKTSNRCCVMSTADTANVCHQ